MSSTAQREALTNTLTEAGDEIGCRAGRCGRHLLCPLGVKAGRMGRVTTGCSSGAQGGKARTYLYTRARGRAGHATGRAERERYAARYCRCAAFLGRGQALVGL